MSKKSQLKKAIDEAEREISALEQKRARSQSALMHAMLTGKEPNPEDKQYFTVFSALIEEARENLRKLMQELDEITNKN